MTHIKGFFFDLDGTLVNTHEANFLAYSDAIKSVTSLSPGAKLRDFIKKGESSNDFLPKVIPEITDDDKKEINKQKKLYYSRYLHASELNEYLSVFLKQMSEQYVTVLVTTAKQDNARAVLRAHDLERYFSFTIFGDDVTRMKPDPEAYEQALMRTGLLPGEALAFEDSQKGIDAATAAGISVVHIKDFV